MRKRSVLAGSLLAAVVAMTSALPAGAVIGGASTSTDDYPWMVFLSDAHAAPDRPSHHTCGGALVAPDKVLTAAHCVDETVPGDLGVIGGRTDLRTDEGQEREVVSIYSHEKVPAPPPPPGSNATPRPGGDLAVLTLDRPLPYEVVPLAAPEDAEHLYREGMPARVLGWGLSREEQLELPGDQTATPVLQQAQLPVVSDRECVDTGLHGSSMPLVFDPDHHVCAGYERGGVATSGGDSGGPVLIDGKLAGIVGFGVHRGQDPALADALSANTEVAAFHDEIAAHLG